MDKFDEDIFANRPKAMSPQALIEFLVREDKEEFVGLVMAMEGHIARLTGELSVYRELTLQECAGTRGGKISRWPKP